MSSDTSTAVVAVTLADAKHHLRVEINDDDTLIESLCMAATQMAEHVLQRALISRGDVVGYGDSPADVPNAIRQWMLLQIGHLYENRESASKFKVEALPFVDRLLDPFRTWG